MSEIVVTKYVVRLTAESAASGVMSTLRTRRHFNLALTSICSSQR